jgi:hypothetical protein
VEIGVVGQDTFSDIIDGSDIKVTLTGPPSFSGKATVSLEGASGNKHVIPVSNGAVLLAGTYALTLNRLVIPTGIYTASVRANWETPWNTVEQLTYQVSRLHVKGVIRHTQYNTPVESQCPAATSDAWLIDDNCGFTKTTLRTSFMGAVYTNGTGRSTSQGILKYQNKDTCLGKYPVGADEMNSFRKVADIRGSCNSPISTSSQAVHPNPKLSGSPAHCMDATLMSDGNDVVRYKKSVADYCPGCEADGHIDNWSSSEYCTGGAVGSLGSFWTAIRLKPVGIKPGTP